MDLTKYRDAYNKQRSGAKHRGIEFLLTFQEWCNFWGDDVDRRGSGPDDLQMQRFADTGPYAIGNIRKGTPRENSATAGAMTRKRNSDEGARLREEALDRMMHEPSEPEYDECPCDEIRHLGFKSSHGQRYFHRI